MILPTPLTITLNRYWRNYKENNKIFTYKHSSDYLSNESDSTIFLQPTDKEEIANIIFSLDSRKASDPSSIPYRILFLLIHDISKELADLFNLSFMTGVFSSVLKTAKVNPAMLLKDLSPNKIKTVVSNFYPKSY